MRRRITAVCAATALALASGTAVAGPAAAKPGRPDDTVPVRLLSLNDFHGHLEPPTGSSGRMVDEHGATVDAGGAAYAAAWLNRMTDRNTLKVAQGDLIGATPLVSAAYHDEPTVEFLNKVGVTASAVGNHEFDEGYAELLRIIKGGCHPVDGCSPAGQWKGADFTYLGANVLLKDAKKLPPVPGMEALNGISRKKLAKELARYGIPALPPITVRKINGVRVGFIGAVTETTPNIVTAEGIKDLTFTDEVKAANFGSYLLKLLNVEAQVMLVHEGDQPAGTQSPDACNTVPGLGTEIATKVDPEIDMVLAGHSHQAYLCTVKDPKGGDRLYSQGGSFGRVITQVDFKVDRRSGDIVRSTVQANNQIVTRDIAPDPAISTFVQTWKDRVATVANRKIGDITADLSRAAAPSGESPLGNLIADAQLAATKAGGGAQIALMNPGGVRADLTYAQSGSEGNGVVTYGEAFTVQPFNNLMQVVTLTGAQLDALLEQQWQPTATRILQPSASLSYTMSPAQPIGSRVSDIKIDGVAISDTATYRVAANNFLVGGGDGFSVFTQGTNLWSGPLDIDAFVDYLGANSPIAPPATNRITVTG
ncbi:bifunctional metallophosphatase/5'-nucleotidase [Actinomadura craniellae]|nr:bifunctional UDP-sugar hydrolase/5'-nucleotidase [Actinomadura craniellae]